VPTPIGSGLEVTWTSTPTKWSNNFFWNLFGYEWELTKSPGGAHQWKPKNDAGAGSIPDAHDKSKRHAPAMLTSDIALRPIRPMRKSRVASMRIRTSSPMRLRVPGSSSPIATWVPIVRYLGKLVPKEDADLAGSDPSRRSPVIGDKDVADLKAKILASGLTVPQLVSTAWASASTFRGSDKRGGANGARIRLAPQKDWEVNQPEQLTTRCSASSRRFRRISARRCRLPT
jgi:catalase-peroxidase